MATPATAEQLSGGVVAVLSIHPPYAEKILAGIKRVELRKAPLRDNVRHVAIYATSPVQKLVGVFSVGQVDVASPDVLWSRYADVAGIDRDSFDRYFAGRDTGVAIGVSGVARLQVPVELQALSATLCPPQNVVYLDYLATRRLKVLVARDRVAAPVSPRTFATWAARIGRTGVDSAAASVRAVVGR